MSCSTASSVIVSLAEGGVWPPVSLCGGAAAGTKRTRSSPRRAQASDAIARWARCGGSNVPPMTPMRASAAAIASGPDLPVAPELVLDAGELLQADRAPGVQLLGGDAHLGAEAELAAVGEARRRIDVDAGRVDLGREPPRGAEVLRHDGLRVARAVGGDVLQCLVQRVDDPDGELQRQELGLVVHLVGPLEGGVLEHVRRPLVDHKVDAASLELLD